MWPARNASFVSGDDERLILNHLLVNHPSLAHAWTLCSRVTDDLYQPVAMISFQLNHALAGPDPSGRFPVSPRGFHWTNLLLHGFCAAMVFLIVRPLAGCSRVALAAGLLFAVHPFAVETVAWINGRMILLATAFGLLVFWMRLRCSGAWIAGPLVAWVLSAASKVMPTLPIAVLWGERQVRGGLKRRDYAVYAIMLVIAAAATALATATTLDVSSGGFEAEGDSGAIVRVLLAWRYYIEGYFWPSRLCAWIPPPQGIGLFDGPVVIGALEIIGFIVAAGIVRRMNRAAFLGLGIFACLLAPFLAAGTTRRFLAADRYMYLPIMGLHLASAALAVQCVDWLRTSWSPRAARVAVGLPFAAVFTACFWWSGKLAECWADSVHRDERIVAVCPNEPEVRAQLAKSHLFQHDSDSALRVVREARGRWPDNGRLASAAGEVFRARREYAAAEREFSAALRLLPEHTRTNYLHALTLEDLGRFKEATAAYERIVAANREYLPALTALARCNRREGRVAEAAANYERALAVNGSNVEALRGLAGILMERGQDERALELLERAAGYELSDFQAVAWLHILMLEHGRGAETAALWERVRAAGLESNEIWAWQAWAYALAGRCDVVPQTVPRIQEANPERAFASWAEAWCALLVGNEKLLLTQEQAGLFARPAGRFESEKRRAIISAIERLPADKRSSEPAIYMVARAFMLDGQREKAVAIARQLAGADPSLRSPWKQAAARLLTEPTTTAP